MPSYTFKDLPDNKVDVMENGASIYGTGTPGVTQDYAKTLGYVPPTTYAADATSSPAKPYTLPAPPQPTNYAATLAAVPTIDSIVGATSPAQDTAVSQGKTFQDKVLETLSKLGAKTGFARTAEDNAGLPDLNKQLTDVNGQIQALQKEANSIPLEDQQGVKGRGVTAGGLAPIEAGRLRENTIKALGLSAIAQTLQGNISLATQQVERAVSAEFDPLQSELDYYKAALQFNQDNMSEADKKQAQVIQGKLQQRQDALDQAKGDRTTVFGYVTDALKNSAPASIASTALSQSPQDALKTLAPYMKVQADAWSSPYLLGGDYVQKNTKTGEIRTAVNMPAGGRTNFTTSQKNNGASNAGVTISQFTGLDADTQNYFINGFSNFQALQKKIDSGEYTKEQAAAFVRDSTTIPANAKTILLNILGVGAANADAGSGAPSLGSVFGDAGSYLRNLFKNVTGI